METIGELLKVIRKNTDADFVKVSGTPKRCVLKNVYNLVNVPGYVVEIYDRDNEKDHLFIADKSNEDYLHDGSAVFDKTYFSGRCLWVFENEVTITPIGGFYI
jgi:hypothetical protein